MENNRLIRQLLAQTMGNYVNKDGLLYFKTKLETIFAKKTDLDTKVDKVSGKQLSTNDYTNAEKQKLAGLNNYTLPTASKTILGGVKVGAGLTIDGEGNLSATGGGEADSVNWENVVGRPTKVSEFTNDSNYQTASQVNNSILTAISSKADNSALTTHTGNSEIHVTATDKQSWNAKADADDVYTKTDIDGKRFQNASQVESTITSKGYQTSSQVQEAINAAVSGITSIEFLVVDDLPESGEKGTIYLMANSGSGQNVYNEYIWVTDKYETIGTTAVDLSNYYNTTNFTAITNQEIDEMFSAA